MNDPENQTRKVGRPATWVAARGRSNSLDGSPTLQRRLSAGQLFNLPAVGPIVDEILSELPLDPNPQVVNDPIPPANTAPAAEQAIPIIPTPADPILPVPESLGPTPEQVANMRLRPEAVVIVDECQEFIKVNEGMKVTSAFLTYINEEASRLALIITTFLNLLPDSPNLEAVSFNSQGGEGS